MLKVCIEYCKTQKYVLYRFANDHGNDSFIWIFAVTILISSLSQTNNEGNLNNSIVNEIVLRATRVIDALVDHDARFFQVSDERVCV